MNAQPWLNADGTRVHAMDVIEKLNAALDETERIALSGQIKGHAHWRLEFGEHGDYEIVDDANRTVVSEREFAVDSGLAVHIAHNDPAAVLRQVAAHRKILDLHQIEFFPPKLNLYIGRTEWSRGRWVCSVCSERRDGIEQIHDGPACPTVLALAEACGIEVET